MLRQKILRKIYYTTFIVFLLFTITSFTLNDDLPNTKVEYQTNLSNIYLLNNENYLVQVGILVENDIIKSIPIILDNLKNNSKHYNGLKGLIPNETKINNISLDNNILYLDFNEELLNVNSDMEEKIIESLIYSFLDFKEIKGLKISINNTPLDKLPKSNIKLDDILTKTFGINKEYSINSFNDVKKVTLYYYQEIDNNKYYVPVTKYINNTDDKIKIIIDNLKNSYLYNTNLMSYLNDKVKIENYEYTSNMVTLSFASILDFSDSILEEEVIYTLSNSILTSCEVNQVIFMANDKIFAIKSK